MPLWHDAAAFGYIPKNGIAGSSGRSIPNFLRNLQIDFQSGSTSLQSHQQWRSVTLSPHPLQHVLSTVVLILAILVSVRWNLRVVSICISLMTKDVEHFLGASQPFGKEVKTIQWGKKTKQNSIFKKWFCLNWQLAHIRRQINPFLSPCTKLKS